MKRSEEMNLKDWKKVGLVILLLFVPMGFYGLGKVVLATPEQKAKIVQIKEVLKSAEIGDMIVATNSRNDRFLMLVLTAPFDGMKVYGFSPYYMAQSANLMVGDIYSVRGDDGSLYIVPKENVQGALDAMISQGVKHAKKAYPSGVL